MRCAIPRVSFRSDLLCNPDLRMAAACRASINNRQLEYRNPSLQHAAVELDSNPTFSQIYPLSIIVRAIVSGSDVTFASLKILPSQSAMQIVVFRDETSKPQQDMFSSFHWHVIPVT